MPQIGGLHEGQANIMVSRLILEIFMGAYQDLNKTRPCPSLFPSQTRTQARKLCLPVNKPLPYYL